MQFTRSSLWFLLTATFFASPNLAMPAAVASPDDALDISILFPRGGNPAQGRPVSIRASCHMSKAILPLTVGSASLSGPDPLKLKVVLLGRGTQNYTCADSTANSKPVPNGAEATLFQASCVAAEAPAILHKMPQTILTNFNSPPGAMFPEVGKHYFHPDATTPVFVLNGKKLPEKKRGMFVGKKAENIPAPADAFPGIVPEAFGAVDWLKLVIKENAGAGLQSVGYQAAYRVHTAGGKPPPTCEGRPAKFTIKYATEYWLYN